MRPNVENGFHSQFTVPIASLLLSLTALGLLVQGAPASPPSPAVERVEREAWVMGTRLRVMVEGPAAAVAAEAALREVERMDRLLSTWDPRAEMARANAVPPGRPVHLSRELHRILAEARAWSTRTGGAFEPAVGSLIDAWDLRGGGRVPGARRLAEARKAAGPGALVVDAEKGTLLRRHPDAWLDTGAFGKGAALRGASARLEAGGVERALLDLGGQLWAEAPPEAPWTVSVAHPLGRRQGAARLRLHGVSVATSGTSERWIEVEGRRLGHILDPRTGRPSPAWGSVTVVHPDPLAADALATALHVMGPDQGLAWLRDRPGIAALFLVLQDGEAIPRWTEAMDGWLAETPEPTGLRAGEPPERYDPNERIDP